MKYLAFTNYWPQRENMTNQYNLFWKSKKKPRKVQSHFLLLSLHFVFMRPQTFEFFKRYVFFQISFFRKIRDTNVHSESFLKFDSLHILVYKSKCIRKKNLNHLVENFFSDIIWFKYQNLQNQIFIELWQFKYRG